MKKQPVVSPLS